MLQHQAKCQLIPMPPCEWDRKARCMHNSSIPLIPQRLCRTQDVITINWTCMSYSHFVSTIPPICLSVCKKLGQSLPHPSLSSVGQLVVSIIRQSFHIPAFQQQGYIIQELPLALSLLMFTFISFSLSGTSKPQSTRPHNPDNWKSGAMRGPPLFKHNYSESIHVHPPLLAEWLNASLCDWSTQCDIPFLQQCGLHPHTVATAICALNLSLSPIVWHLVF